jgi:hypothetical protein
MLDYSLKACYIQPVESVAAPSTRFLEWGDSLEHLMSLERHSPLEPGKGAHQVLFYWSEHE